MENTAVEAFGLSFLGGAHAGTGIAATGATAAKVGAGYAKAGTFVCSR